MDEAYRRLFIGIASDDEEGRAEVLKPVMEFNPPTQTTVDGSGKGLKSIVARMNNAKDQFTTLVWTHTNLTYLSI
jgi:hypothetical protein